MSMEELGCEPLVVLFLQLEVGSEEGVLSGQSISSSTPVSRSTRRSLCL